MNWKFYLAVGIALVLDVFDYGLGWIPIFGDFFDIIGIAMLLPLIGPSALFAIFEFLPIIGDLAPSFLVAVALSRTSFMRGIFGGSKKETEV